MSDNPAYTSGRKPRGFGLGKLTGRRVGIIVGGVVACLVAGWISLALMGLLILVFVPTVLLAVIPFGAAGKTIGNRISERVRFGSIGVTGAYADDVLSEVPRGENLPGVLAPIVPVEVEDGRGGHQCLLWNRRTGILTAPLMISPVGLTLADDADALTWVTNFGGMLADLGHMPAISSVGFTVESAPTGGMDQRAYTRGRIEAATKAAAARNAPPPPAVCIEVMSELSEQSRAQTADVKCLVSLNFDLTKANPVPKTLQAGCAEVVTQLPRYESSLAACGMTVTHRLSKGEVIRYLRMAFDPAVRTSEYSENDEFWQWRDAGPIRTEESADIYAHDSGYSVSWLYSESLGGLRRFRGLLPLVSPGPYHRRFSMIYRPYSAAEATETVEKEVTGGTIRRLWASKTKKDETQRDHDDRVRTRKMAQEESLGAGLGLFTFYVTTTVRNEKTLSTACADVERRMAETRTKWRRARRAQSGAFAASLGLGIDPTSSLSRMPKDRWGA